MKPTIPAGWTWSTLENVAAPIPNAIVDGPFGSNLKLTDYVEGAGVPVLQGKNVTGDQFAWFDVRFISAKKAAELKRSSVRVGDILLVKIGSIGYTAIIDDLKGFDHAIIPANLAKITPDSRKVDTGYLHHWLKSTESKRYLIDSASKTAQPALSLTKVKKLKVPLPPMEEQRRIAAILDQAEALGAKRRHALAKLDTLTQSLFLEMFGDPTTNPKRWTGTKLGELTHEFRYGTSNKSSLVEGYPALRIPNVLGGTLNLDEIKTVPVDHSEFERLRLRANDLLFVRTNGNRDNVGRCALFDEHLIRNSGFGGDEFIYASYLIRARLRSEQVDPIFLRDYLLSPEGRRQLAARSKTSAGQFNINTESLAQIPILLPPLPLQQDYARKKVELDSLKSRFFAMQRDTNALSASLQSQAFRGEL